MILIYTLLAIIKQISLNVVLMNITIPLAGSPDPFVESCCVAPEAPSFPFWLLPSALLILSALTISSIPILVVLCVSHGPVLTPVALAVPIVVFVSNAAPVFVAWVPFFYKFNSRYGYSIIATQFYLIFELLNSFDIYQPYLKLFSKKWKTSFRFRLRNEVEV